MVTSQDEPLSVQVTPQATEKVHPQVVERSTDRIVIEDFSEGPDNYQVSYTVKGVRQGFEQSDIIQDTDITGPDIR